MERLTCRECELAFLKQLWDTDIEDFYDESIRDLWENICVKCFVRICNRFLD